MPAQKMIMVLPIVLAQLLAQEMIVVLPVVLVVALAEAFGISCSGCCCSAGIASGSGPKDISICCTRA